MLDAGTVGPNPSRRPCGTVSQADNPSVHVPSPTLRARTGVCLPGGSRAQDGAVRCLRSFALALVLAACRPRGTTEAPATRRPEAPVAREAPAVEPMTPPDAPSTRWAVTAREAEAHGLAAIGFAFEEVPRSLIATRFPAPGTLAVFSGPPGGPLGILVESDGLSGGDAAALHDALRTAPSTRIGAERVIGDPVERAVGGVTRAAVAMLAGTGRARTHYCVVVIPAVEGAGRGLLVWLYAAGGGVAAPSCEAVLGHPVLAAAAEGFRVLAPAGARP